MRITIVVPFVNLTGGIRVVLQCAYWLHDAGHDVTVVYPLWPYRYHFSRRDQLSEFRRACRAAPRIDWFDLRCRLVRVPRVSNVFLPRADVVLVTSWPAVHDVARLHRSCGAKVSLLFHHETGTGPEHRIRRIYALPFRRIAFSTRVQAELDVPGRKLGADFERRLREDTDQAQRERRAEIRTQPLRGCGDTFVA